MRLTSQLFLLFGAVAIFFDAANAGHLRGDEGVSETVDVADFAKSNHNNSGHFTGDAEDEVLLVDDQDANRKLCACSLSTPGCCISHPGDIGTHEYLGEFRINVKNKCHKTIWVGIHYLTESDPEVSCLGGGSWCTGGWVTKGWWKLSPRETNYIAATTNRIIYLTAHSSDGMTWGEKDIRREVRGEYHDFFKVTLPNSFTRWTQSFTCN